VAGEIALHGMRISELKSRCRELQAANEALKQRVATLKQRTIRDFAAYTVELSPDELTDLEEDRAGLFPDEVWEALWKGGSVALIPGKAVPPIAREPADTPQD